MSKWEAEVHVTMETDVMRRAGDWSEVTSSQKCWLSLEAGMRK